VSNLKNTDKTLVKFQDLEPAFPDVLDPDDFDSEDEMEAYLEKFVHYSRLNKRHRMLIKAYAEDLAAGKPRSDAQIAEELGIGLKTIRTYKTDPDFAQACGFIMANITASNTPQIISKIHEIGNEGSWNALKFLLELSGVYTQKLQTQNVNVNVNQTRPSTKSFDEALDELLIALGAAGWSAAMIVERYNTLRAQGAW